MVHSVNDRMAVVFVPKPYVDLGRTGELQASGVNMGSLTIQRSEQVDLKNCHMFA
jgi:hypothetical protein